MLRNCVIPVHTNMLDCHASGQINMPCVFLVKHALWREEPPEKKSKSWLHKTMQIPAKIGFMLPRHANSVKNEDSGFRPEVQKRGNSHKSSRQLCKKRCVFEGVVNDAVDLFEYRLPGCEPLSLIEMLEPAQKKKVTWQWKPLRALQLLHLQMIHFQENDIRY